MLKLVIIRWHQGILTMLTENDREIEFLYETEGVLSVGDIVIGRVKDVVKNINAVFIETSPGVTCYLSMEDAVSPVYVNRISPNTKRLVQGDEILVQVIKNRMKTKDAVVTTNLSFTGKYAVLTTGNPRLGVSMKLDASKRRELKEKLKDSVPENAGVVVRTNAAAVSADEILHEISELQEQMNRIITYAGHRTCYSIMQHAPERYLQLIRDLKKDTLDEIITDDPVIHDTVLHYMQETQALIKEGLLKLYRDNMIPLYKVYSIETKLEKALNERVWLKSGGYLIIEPTEALTVIDVNTGKFTGKKNAQDTFMKINLEAAEEIAHQLRLRNISGIIIIDFINMKHKENQNELLENLKTFVKKDRIKTDVFDMTKLNLVEMTRKKVDKSIYEYFVVNRF